MCHDKSLVSGLTPRGSKFNFGPVHMRFTIDNAAIKQVFLSFSFPLSVTLHKCSIITSGRQVGKARESSNKEMFCRISGSTGQKSRHTCFSRGLNPRCPLHIYSSSRRVEHKSFQQNTAINHWKQTVTNKSGADIMLFHFWYLLSLMATNYARQFTILRVNLKNW